jgi:hypothetical protein
MKSNRPLSEIAAKVLASEARQPARLTSDARARAIDAIARTMSERKRRHRLKLRALGTVAIAASIAIAVGLARNGHRAESAAPHDSNALAAPTGVALAASIPTAAASFVRGSPVVVRQGARRQVFEGTLLEPGDRLVVDPGSRTTVALAGGTYLVVEERAELVLVSSAPSTTFELDSGSVRADVAKLRPHERFVIRTSDAEIEVHGTSFEVFRVASDPTCGNGTTTRVKVREGIVAVRAGGTETFVHANEAWPRDCSIAATSPAPAETRPSDATTASGVTTTPSVSRRRADPPASDLAAQNDQFERALARKRAGDVSGAIAAFEEFLARYPASHLAQSARAERMKLLRGVDRERARAAARAYLETYPNGFARRDAEVILSTGGSP